jgi:hypothetical protein
MSQTPSSTASPLTVVLVHGAFADASSRYHTLFGQHARLFLES